jgi:hypothetical protein
MGQSSLEPIVQSKVTGGGPATLQVAGMNSTNRNKKFLNQIDA